MKYFVIILVIMLIMITSIDISYGLWVPKTPERLFEQSETVFVGTVTSVNVLEFERSNTYHIEENGVSRIEIENYTQSLDEYTVEVEEFLKNPQESHTITMLEATVGGVPGRNVSIGGFELDDRVLFYIPKIDGTNQYFPESFEIPKQCDAKSVLKQPKITLANDFKMMQDGISLNDNFTVNKPIQFVYNKDMRTLEGRNFDVKISISKIIGNDREIAIKENIHTKSKPCEWISTASWEFVPTAGKYSMIMHTSEGNSTGGATSSGGFTVIEDISSPTRSIFPLHGYHAYDAMSPLKQTQHGISIDKIQCKESLLLVTKHDGSPACVKSETITKLIERNWIKSENKLEPRIIDILLPEYPRGKTVQENIAQDRVSMFIEEYQMQNGNLQDALASLRVSYFVGEHLFVINADTKETILHPDPDKIGILYLTLGDNLGESIIAEIPVLQNPGYGFINHTDINPRNGNVDTKTVWLLAYDGLVFGSGFFASDCTPEHGKIKCDG